MLGRASRYAAPRRRRQRKGGAPRRAWAWALAQRPTGCRGRRAAWSLWVGSGCWSVAEWGGRARLSVVSATRRAAGGHWSAARRSASSCRSSRSLSAAAAAAAAAAVAAVRAARRRWDSPARVPPMACPPMWVLLLMSRPAQNFLWAGLFTRVLAMAARCTRQRRTAGGSTVAEPPPRPPRASLEARRHERCPTFACSSPARTWPPR